MVCSAHVSRMVSKVEVVWRWLPGQQISPSMDTKFEALTPEVRLASWGRPCP